MENEYEEAKKIVIREQRASTPFLQRKLRIGYMKAARLLDMLEENGVVEKQEFGPLAAPRKVLIKP